MCSLVLSLVSRAFQFVCYAIKFTEKLGKSLLTSRSANNAQPRVGFCLKIALQDHSLSHVVTIPPTMTQVESKTNNRNWIHCRKCHFQYCHLCREACFGAWHFSEYGCKQLTTVTEDLALFTQERRRKRTEGEAIVETDNLP